MEYERRKTDAERNEMDRRTADDVHTLTADIAVLQSQMRDLRDQVGDLVTRLEFVPIKLLVYGLSGTLLSGVVAALLAQVLRHP